MANLQQFFNGGGGSVPLRALVPFPFDTPPKVTVGGQVFLRTGLSEAVDYDPSLQSWVDDNIMFTNTLVETNGAASALLPSAPAVDTDGAGKWMVAMWPAAGIGLNLPRIYYSEDDGLTFAPKSITGFPTGWLVKEIKSGGMGVWIVRAEAGTTAEKFFRTTDDGDSWTDISVALLGNTVVNDVTYETDRNGVWLATAPGQTNMRRSTDNGATWGNSQTSVGQDVKGIKYGGGRWVIGIEGYTADIYSSIRISTDAGLTWGAAITVSFYDYVFAKGEWVAWTNLGFSKPNDNTLATWSAFHPLYQDTLSDFNVPSGSMTRQRARAGLDGAIWLTWFSHTFRSTDNGLSWLRYDENYAAVMSGPNKRAVGVFIPASSTNQPINGQQPGIVTGRPAAGVPRTVLDTGGNDDRRAVMYICIR